MGIRLDEDEVWAFLDHALEGAAILADLTERAYVRVGLAGFALLAIGHALVLYGLTYSLSRYAVPLRPLLAVAVAWAATHRGDVLARLRGDRRVAVVVAVLAAWRLVAWSRDLTLLADLLATGGKGFPFVRDALP